MDRAQHSSAPAAASSRKLESARSLAPSVPAIDDGKDGQLESTPANTVDEEVDDDDEAEGLDSLSPLPPSPSRPSSLRADVDALPDDAPVTLSKRHLVAIINEIDELRGGPQGSDVESGESAGTTIPPRQSHASREEEDADSPSLWSWIVSFFTPRRKPTVLFRRTAAEADERARNGSFRDNPLRGAHIAPHHAVSLRQLPVDIVPHRSLRYLNDVSPARATYHSGGEHVDLSSSPSIRRLSSGASGVAPTRLAGINSFLHAASTRFGHAPSSAPKRRVIMPRIEDDDGGGGVSFAESNPMANLRSSSRGLGQSPSLTTDDWEDAGAALRLGMRSSRNVMAMDRGARGGNSQFSQSMVNGAAERLDGAFRGAANPMGVRQSAAQTAAVRAAEREAMLHFSVENNVGGAGGGLGQRMALTRGASVRQHVSGKVAAAIKRVGAALTSSPLMTDTDSYMGEGAAARLGSANGGNPMARSPAVAAHQDFAMDDATAAQRLNGSLYNSAVNPRFTRSPTAGQSTAASPAFHDDYAFPGEEAAELRLGAFEGGNPLASRHVSSQRRMVTEAEWPGAAAAEARLGGFADSTNFFNPLSRAASPRAPAASDNYAFPGEEAAESRLRAALGGTNAMARRY